MVLWTRVTPTRAATPGSGRGPQVAVRWEVAARRPVPRRRPPRPLRHRPEPRPHGQGRRDRAAPGDRRTTTASPGTASRSRAGRTRTAPADARDAATTCGSAWSPAPTCRPAGSPPTATSPARDDLHAVLHLGDYLYEYAPGEYGHGPDNDDVRPHDPPREMVSLADYRRRHAQYKSDPDLQDLHARYAWIITWDDHEVTNDQWRARRREPPARDRGRLPAPPRPRPPGVRRVDAGPDGRAPPTCATATRLFRRLRFGRLAELSMLDLRTYRSRAGRAAAHRRPRSPTPRSATPAAPSPATGSWTGSRTRCGSRRPQWKLIGNPVMIAPVDFGGAARRPGRPDQRRHRAAARGRRALQRRPVGRLHRRPAPGLRPHPRPRGQGRAVRDRRHPLRLGLRAAVRRRRRTPARTRPSRRPASSSSARSVTSNNLKDITGDPTGATSTAVEEGIKANNRHVKYLNFDDHGFSVLDITADRAQMDWFVISDRADRDADGHLGDLVADPLRHRQGRAGRPGRSEDASRDRPARSRRPDAS